jgi:2-polyprenyl-3-methyl-5-hydroxy-6-metoxy-1,4-benzoquinol methylase
MIDGMNRLQMIRHKEKAYHDECYEKHRVFQPGSWLHKPAKTVLELMRHFAGQPEVDVLDLGSGVGRNSIPIAEMLKQKKGNVVCVDLLESAIAKLHEYSRQYGVEDRIFPVLSDISEYEIPAASFDFIFAVSALEHLESEEVFDAVLERMIKGTRPEGINAIVISTDIRETRLDTGEPTDPMYELMFDTDDLLRKFASIYKGWELLKRTVKPYAIEISRDGRTVLLESKVITWAVRKPQHP